LACGHSSERIMTPDASDIKTSFYKGNFEECIDLIKNLADEGGDAVAADIYGDILMSGEWDTRKMEVSFANINRNTLTN
jgi:hypothetical protein